MLGSCAANQPLTNPVTWYLVNSGSQITLVVQDLVCNRRYNNVRVASGREAQLQTCGDENGEAHVRYRVDGYASRSSPWTTRRVNPDARVFVQ